ncbi:MAG: hypothetical protein ACE1ZL_05065, partial [Gammaproteobacteria bacterium]
ANPVGGETARVGRSRAAPAPAQRIEEFRQILLDGGIMTTTRRTRGQDIDAACGQLAGRVKDRTTARLGDKLKLQAANA